MWFVGSNISQKNEDIFFLEDIMGVEMFQKYFTEVSTFTCSKCGHLLFTHYMKRYLKPDYNIFRAGYWEENQLPRGFSPKDKFLAKLFFGTFFIVSVAYLMSQN